MDYFVASPLDTESSLKHFVREVVLAGERGEPIKSLAVDGEDRVHAVILTAIGYLTVDDVSDEVAVTTSGRLFAGLKPEGVPTLDVDVAEVTGNIPEGELAARYMEGKMVAIDRAIAGHDEPIYDRSMNWTEAYQHMAIIFRESANEFRMGLHLPSVHIDGRVIPYNEDRSSGLQHQVNLALFFTDVYGRNVKAGWWTDIKTGLPKKRNVGELFILFITEIVEAYMAYRDNLADDKLPQYPGLGVEMADLGIRWADFCGALMAGNIVEHSGARNPGDEMFIEILEIAQRYETIRKTPEAVGEPEEGEPLPAQDVAKMVDAKLDFNATRADHKIENRLKEGGKQT